MRYRFVIVLVIATGCGGGSKPEISTNKDNVCGQIASVACYNLYQCCSEGQIETYLKVSDPRTQGECESDVARLCEQRIGIVDTSIAAGRVTFNATVMDACLKALIAPDNTCSSVASMLPWTAACMDSAWVGTVAVGGMCTHNFECANPGSAFCAANQVCTALPAEGMPCAPSGACAAGFYCDFNNNRICHMQLAAGSVCTSNQQCLKGNYCNNAQPRVCAPLQGPGQSCTGNQSCQSNQCLPGVCAGSINNTCFTGADCGGRCSNNQNFCQQDAQCGQGTCSIGATPCNNQTQCTGTGNTCVFPNTCNLIACTGNVVCADTQINADYCTTAVADIPTPP